MVKKRQDPTPESPRPGEVAGQASRKDVDTFVAGLLTGAVFDESSLPEPEPVELPPPPDTPSLLRVRVDLDGAKPPIWRRLELRGDLTVEQVHGVLQVAMGWEDSHLHRFWLPPGKDRWGFPALVTDFDVEEGEEGTHEGEVQVEQLLRAVGDRLFYTYDYGDAWNHTIKVEAVSPLPEDLPSARCTGGRNACPPEDVGGVGTHNGLAAALREAPDRSTLGDYAEWLPLDWDPTEFDPDQVNLMLALRDVNPEQLLEMGAAAPPVCPALEELIGRAPQDIVMELAATTALAMAGEPGQDDATGADAVDSETLARAVRPWQLLLQIAGVDGIPLTAAGWMKPAVVERVHRELGLDREWIGKGNREDQTYPVMELRESAQALGLLRKRKDRLLPTPRGRELTDDDAGLWGHLAAHAIPETDEFARDASALYLLELASGGEIDRDAFDDVAHTLTVIGWSRPGRPEGVGVSSREALDGARSTWKLVLRLSGAHALAAVGADLLVARSFARDVLFPSQP